MSKKSNIIVGLGIVLVIALVIGGVVLVNKGKGKENYSVNEHSLPSHNAYASVEGPKKTTEQAVSTASSSSKESPSSVTEEGVFVASKTGKAYFPASCTAAKRIKDENKVTFSSKDEAEKAGYTPAKNCK